MSVLRLTVVVGSVILVGAACAGDGTGLPLANGEDQVTLSGDVQPILSNNCVFSGCHVGTSPQEGLTLSSGQTFGNVVNVASRQLTTMNRVTPNQPDNSYLVHKVQGTHLDEGGSGERMPEGRAPLSQAEIDLIRAWIQAGAKSN